MRSKLHAIAQTFVREVGDELQDYTFVFPNHRAGLFFRKYLSQHIEQPLFAPRVMSINECFAELSDLQVADPLTLLLRLYDTYQQLRPDTETLDRFIYWGKMMLADFSEIDNHLVPHVEALFASVQDLHAIDERFAYLTDNQRRALSRFWLEFQTSNDHHPNAELHERFLHTWDVLYPLYVALRTNLLQDGLAYEGMLHREVLEHWDAIPAERFRKQYVFLGFNALTASERELMLRLQAMDRADFYFDYDSPYLSDPQNKASLFKEENLHLFSSRFEIPDSQLLTSCSEAPQITLISVPSTVGEVHEVYRILSDIIPVDCQDLTRTAVVLPDEQLLIPLLNAFPESVSKINVTMGYPLRATSLYMPVAYPEQYLIPMPETAEVFIAQMRECLLSQLCDDNAEGVYQLTKVLDRLQTALTTYPNIAFAVADVQQLLKMLTLETTIPYVGEPLDGLQVMGVLETRALDFDNVIITGFNDDLYPGRTSSNSFVPYTLRCGFDLPTPDRQNAIFAYNFYRMLSYAKRVWLITNSTADEQHSGEVSRYFYQLKWQYDIDIQHVVVTNQLTALQTSSCEPIAKDDRLQTIHSLSATALTTYLRCQKQFHYKYIEHLQEPAPDESISASELTIGNVLHAIMEHLYAPFVGKNVTATDIEHLLAQANDDAYWHALEPLQQLCGDGLANRVVRTYVNNILRNDHHHAPFQYVASETRLSAQLNDVWLYGFADRIDLKANTLRVIDYKTGKTDLAYENMAKVFGVVEPAEEGVIPVRTKGQRQILQTLLYCWMYTASCQLSTATCRQPYIFSARNIAPEDMPVVHHNNQPLSFQNVEQEFLTHLQSLLEEILDANQPFAPTSDKHTCESCAFLSLCTKNARATASKFVILHKL
ncbi:MAG: PD-(D/E)XK nuclease family protein [Paludibacteraceae bacterium]|nr:PD-(D/E)XK nuclease family protein [Paludibacteraceae bacterium]